VKENPMTWDMVLVTVTLITVLLLIVLLALISQIWQDETPRKPGTASRSARTLASPSSKIDKVAGQENSLA
jgi:hypothetical protein